MNTVKKNSADMERGDLVVFADIVDEVQAVTSDESSVLRVDVIRRKIGDRDMAVPMFWYAGTKSVQDVCQEGGSE